MFRQELVAWPTPVSFSTKRAISFDALSGCGHLKPNSPEELTITDISELLSCEQPEKVTKHTAAKYVQSFRNEGILKLGTFGEFRESDNPANQDPTEGQQLVWIEQSDLSYYDVGGADESFKIFCTSLKHAKSRETSGYGDSRYVIEDLQGFLYAVAQQTGMIPLALSRCLYRNSRVLNVRDETTVGCPNPLNPPTNIQKYAQIGLSFIKPHGHAEHAEFRFLWHDPEKRIPSSGIVRCPSARDYCSFS